MLTTIEQKLSAIKAINEEKEYVEKRIGEVLNLGESINRFVSLVFDATDDTIYFELPVDQLKLHQEVLRDYFIKRREELISNAEDLMK